MARARIVLLGDSLTQCGFDASVDGWAAALAHAYSRRADVINRGFNGYNTALLAERLDDVLCGLRNSALCVLWMGANDATVAGAAQHVPLSAFRERLREIVEHVRSHCSASILLLTPPALGEHADRRVESTREYAAAVAALGETMALPVVDLFAAIDPREDLLDGLHFNALGSRKVGAAVLAAIAEHFPELAPDSLPMHQADWRQLLGAPPKRS